MGCNHETKHLMGTADGILCRSCGRLFTSMDEILAERVDGSAVPDQEPDPAPIDEKPKRTRKRKGE